MNTSWIINWELILAIIGVVFSIVQIIRNKQLKDSLRKIKKQSEVELWTLISIVVKTFDSLEIARSGIQNYFSKCKDIKGMTVLQNALMSVQSARRGTVDQYKNLLKEASLREENFSLEIINKWVINGRLENAWRYRQALKLLETAEIPDSPISIKDVFKNYPLGSTHQSTKLQPPSNSTKDIKKDG